MHSGTRRIAPPVLLPVRRVRQGAALALLTGTTATVALWLRRAVETRPRWREPVAAAAGDPPAARDEQRLADTPLWRLAERWLALQAVKPFIVRPTFKPLRVLNLDHGPGGLACALARRLPGDATIVAVDAAPGMAHLARHRAARRLRYRTVHFAQAWPHDLPFRDGAFDAVVSACGLHQWPNPHQTLVELRRALADGGRYYVADFRRDLNLGQWLLVRFVQAVMTPLNLRALGEPSASIGAAYAPHEAEWLAARAKLPDLQIRLRPVWLTIEPSEARTRARRQTR